MLLLVIIESFLILVNSLHRPLQYRTRYYLSSSPNNNIFNDENNNMNNEIINNYNEYQQLFNTEEYELYDPTLPEEEILDEMRLAKLIENDRWQSTHFRDNQGNEWTGSYETYVPLRKLNNENKNILGFTKVNAGIISTSINAGEFTLEGVSIDIKEKYKSYDNNSNVNSKMKNVIDILEQCTKMFYKSTDFRILGGNQIVANVFTLCNISPTSPTRYY